MDDLIKRIRQKTGRDEAPPPKEGDRVEDLFDPGRLGTVQRIEEVFGVLLIDVRWDDGDMDRGRGGRGLRTRN